MTALTAPRLPMLGALRSRRSTRAFDSTPLADGEISSLLEAARWAPSAVNRQPWRFVVGRSGDATHTAIVESLAPGNQQWATAAPLLLVTAARLADDDATPEAPPDRLAAYETGMATAHLEVQALHLGLVTHHMGGYDAAALGHALGVPANWALMTVLAVGRPGRVTDLPDALRERELAPRTRLPLSDLAYTDAWGAPADLS